MIALRSNSLAPQRLGLRGSHSSWVVFPLIFALGSLITLGCWLVSDHYCLEYVRAHGLRLHRAWAPS